MGLFASLSPALALQVFFAIGTSLLLEKNGSIVPYYTLEEHWVSPSLAPAFFANTFTKLLIPPAAESVLREVGPKRLASMDANNIHIQVISHVPTTNAMSDPDRIRTANDELAAAIAGSPDPARFRGFCVLPMAYPAAAVQELRRCVKKNGFVGALVDAKLANGSFYDGKTYDPLWKAFSQLQVPVYLHPTYPSEQSILAVGQGLYAPALPGEYDAGLAARLGTVAWGWHEQTGFEFLRFYLGGVFDRYPDLQIVLGHMGEMLPYMLSRAGDWLNKGRTLRVEDAYARNVYVTTSGMFSLDPMATLLRNTNKTRIMYSVDWPLSRNEDGAAFMRALKGSGMVTEDEFENIAYRNAERLLGLKASK
jgi:predicted TIM-barrel fold metal-dependent hydrolase